MIPLVYTSALLVALVLLYFFHARWYWHVLSVIVALTIGFLPPNLIPLPLAWGTTRDLIIGWVFVFLMAWGLCAPLFRRNHGELVLFHRHV
jgi:hypothetical protein